MLLNRDRANEIMDREGLDAALSEENGLSAVSSAPSPQQNAGGCAGPQPWWIHLGRDWA